MAFLNGEKILFSPKFVQGSGSGSDIQVDQTYNPESQNAQSGKAVAEAINTNPDRHAEYFTITDEGVISLKPEYRGACPSNRSTFTFAISDNGIDAVGSKNAELPKNLAIPEIVNNVVVNALANGMFLSNNAIESIALPSTIEEIPDRFCDGSNNLKHIYNTENIIKIGITAFQATSLIKAFFPNLKTINGIGIFNNCGYLIYADIGSVTDIPQNTFGYCINLNRVKNLGIVKTVGANAFFDTFNLKNLELTDSLTSIGKTAFWCSKVEYDWGNLTNTTFDTNATMLQVNPTDFWSNLTPTVCENLLPTLLAQRDERWADREIGTSSWTYKQGCSLMTCLHIYCGLKNVKMESVTEFEEIMNAVNPELLNNFDTTLENAKTILEALGFNCTIYNGYDEQKLNTLYTSIANGGYAYVRVSGTGMGALTGHAVAIYGINDKKELLVADSEFRYRNNSSKACTYTMPYQKFIAPSTEFLVVSLPTN